jgi:hypothetical protein
VVSYLPVPYLILALSSASVLVAGYPLPVPVVIKGSCGFLPYLKYWSVERFHLDLELHPMQMPKYRQCTGSNDELICVNYFSVNYIYALLMSSTVLSQVFALLTFT